MKEGMGGKGGGGGKGGVMTQSLYAHMNKGNKKKNYPNDVHIIYIYKKF
jgi:hypothetical protein